MIVFCLVIRTLVFDLIKVFDCIHRTEHLNFLVDGVLRTQNNNNNNGKTSTLQETFVANFIVCMEFRTLYAFCAEHLNVTEHFNII